MFLSRNVNTDGFKVNTQSHLLPVLATSIKVILCLTSSHDCCLQLISMLIESSGYTCIGTFILVLLIRLTGMLIPGLVKR